MYLHKIYCYLQCCNRCWENKALYFTDWTGLSYKKKNPPGMFFVLSIFTFFFFFFLPQLAILLATFIIHENKNCFVESFRFTFIWASSLNILLVLFAPGKKLLQNRVPGFLNVTQKSSPGVLIRAHFYWIFQLDIYYSGY